MRISIHSLPILIAADPSLGRVDYSSLSDQTLMELLIDGFDAEEKQIFQSQEGMYLDVCEWSCVSCDNNGRVVKIKDSHNNTPGGSLALSYVPPKVKEFDMSCKRSLVGSVELTNLPHGMKILSVSYNQITGSVNLTRLPDSIKYLCLDNNELTGSVDLANLPQSMRVLFLHKNQLTGSLDLTQLPQHVELVFLQDNQFTGSVDLAHLPAKTEGVYLTNNQLSGSFIATNLPAGLNLIDVRGNQFEATAVVETNTKTLFKLNNSGVKSAVREYGNEKVGRLGLSMNAL